MNVGRHQHEIPNFVRGLCLTGPHEHAGVALLAAVLTPVWYRSTLGLLGGQLGGADPRIAQRVPFVS